MDAAGGPDPGKGKESGCPCRRGVGGVHSGGTPLAPKTTHHIYATLCLIFA